MRETKIRWEISDGQKGRREVEGREEEASEGEKRSQRMAGGCGRMEEGREGGREGFIGLVWEKNQDSLRLPRDAVLRQESQLNRSTVPKRF